MWETGGAGRISSVLSYVGGGGCWEDLLCAELCGGFAQCWEDLLCAEFFRRFAQCWDLVWFAQGYVIWGGVKLVGDKIVQRG